MVNILLFQRLWEKQTNQTLSEMLINYLKKQCNIYTLDYSLNEYSLALFINQNAKFNPKYLDNFFFKKIKILIF